MGTVVTQKELAELTEQGFSRDEAFDVLYQRHLEARRREAEKARERPSSAAPRQEPEHDEEFEQIYSRFMDRYWRVMGNWSEYDRVKTFWYFSRGYAFNWNTGQFEPMEPGE